MSTSGTTTFNLELIDLCEEAFERAGLELLTSYDFRTATRSLNIMMQEWQNKGVNLWTIEERSVTLVQGTEEYNLATDVVDVLEHVIRTNDGSSNQMDYPLTRVSMARYAAQPSKLTQGRPNIVWFDRQTTPRLVVYPVPDANTYKIYYWVARVIEDAGSDGSLNMDIPKRFIPAIVAGLAYYIAMKHPEVTDRVVGLKTDYDEQFKLATAEDREKVSTRLRPMRYDRGR